MKKCQRWIVLTESERGLAEELLLLPESLLIGAHLRANRCGARLVKTVNSCEGKTVGSFWDAVHIVLDFVVPIMDRYRLGHQPVISTWPKHRETFLRLLAFPLK